MFGEDKEIVQTVKLAVGSGSEVTVHGWKHEDLTQLSYEEQSTLLSQARSRIEEVLGSETSVLVPPMFAYNEDTITAMQEQGYDVISTFADLPQPAPNSIVTSLPATVELSDYSNGTWKMKSYDSVKAEILKSVQQYGFAIIVTHPQEFIADSKLNQVDTELYKNLIKALKDEYSFKTLAILAENLSH